MNKYLTELIEHINELLKNEGYAVKETEDDIDYVNVYLNDKEIYVGIPLALVKKMESDGLPVKIAAEQIVMNYKAQYDMVEQAMNEIENDEDEELIQVDINDFEKVKDSIFFYLVNFERNKDNLEDYPHKRFLDLAVMFGCVSGYNDDLSRLATISNEQLNAYGITVDKLYEIAFENMKEQFPGVAEFPFVDDDSEDDGCILFNNCYDKGAGVLLYYEKFDEITDFYDGDLLICPLKADSLFIFPCPKNENGKDYEMIQEFYEANRAMLKSTGIFDNDELFLSDNIYIYNRATGIIEIAPVNKEK